METPDWFDESQFVPTPEDRLPAADIDELFEQAFDNPGYRAEFQRRLLESHLWVLIENEPDLDERLGEYGFMAPLNMPDGSLPLFTSEARVRAGKLPPDIRWVSVYARELLEQIAGTAIVVNPFSQRNYTLQPDGLARMLAGDFDDPSLVRKAGEAPASGSVTISTVKEWPDGLLEALRVVLSQHPRVRAAYLVYLLTDEPGTLNRYHLRVDVETPEVHQLVKEMGPVLRAFMQRDEGFELWSALGDDDVAKYMQQQGAIYQRV